jgi:hypothetical protein
VPDDPHEETPTPDVIAAAEFVLEDALGGPVRLGETQKLRGNTRASVYRVAILDGPGDAPASVVMKLINPIVQQPGDLASALAAWTFANEWASLRFLSELASELAIPPLAPRLYGGDQAASLIVMEDLGSGLRLDHELLGADPDAAEAALVEYAILHGRLHGLTRGWHADYASIREALGPMRDPIGRGSGEDHAPDRPIVPPSPIVS